MATIQYEKVDVNSAEVATLATAMGVERKAVVALINQDRYRRAYNKLRNAEIQTLRRLVKEHPELVKGGAK